MNESTERADLMEKLNSDLERAKESGDREEMARCTKRITDFALENGIAELALMSLNGELKIYGELRDGASYADALARLSQLQLELGDTEDARELAREAAKISNELGQEINHGRALVYVARTFAADEEFREAAIHLGQATEVLWEARDLPGVAFALRILSQSASEADNPRAAVRFLAAAAAMEVGFDESQAHETLNEARALAPAAGIAPEEETETLTADGKAFHADAGHSMIAEAFDVDPQVWRGWRN